MSEGTGRNAKGGVHSGRGSGQRRSIIPQTPDVLQHKSRPRGRSRSRQDSVNFRTTKSQIVTNTGSARESRKWYEDGFPALRVADKKIKEVRIRQESRRREESANKKKRSRSYSRGRSVYSQDTNLPYYRSKSVDRINLKNASFVPVTNEIDVINMTYTGRSTRESSSTTLTSKVSTRGPLSRRGSGIVQKKVDSVVPYMRDSYEFDDLQTRIYQQIQKLYGRPDSDVKHKQFFTTFGQIQSDHKRIKTLKINEEDKTILEKMFQAFQQLKLETGKILKDTTRRYSTQKQACPLNKKVRQLPRTYRNEDFLAKLPKTRDRLKLKPLKPEDRGRRHLLVKGRRNIQKYDEYDFDSRNKNIKKDKEPSQPSEMLKFLQRAERMLTQYNEELQTKSLKTRSADQRYTSGPPKVTSRPTSMVSLNNGRKSLSRIARVYENHKDGAPFGRLTPLKSNSNRLSTVEANKTGTSGYVRPEAFYNPRTHAYHNDRARLLNHRLNESRQTHTQLYGLAT